MTQLNYAAYAVFYTAGDLNHHDMIQECHPEGWSPILILRGNDGKIYVPLFHNYNLAIKFIKKNIDKDQFRGVIRLTEENLEIFSQKGWTVLWHDYPKLYRDRTDLTIDIEVIELQFTLSVDGKMIRH